MSRMMGLFPFCEHPIVVQRCGEFYGELMEVLDTSWGSNHSWSACDCRLNLFAWAVRVANSVRKRKLQLNANNGNIHMKLCQEAQQL
jgi:hypothetical protein